MSDALFGNITRHYLCNLIAIRNVLNILGILLILSHFIQQLFMLFPDGLSFHSATAVYQKLVSSTPQKRKYWTDKCAGKIMGYK